MPNPGKPEQVLKALDLYTAGASMRSAVEQAGISHMTLLRHLAALGRATVALKEDDHELAAGDVYVEAGKDAVRTQVWHAIAERVIRQVPDESIPFRELRDGLVAYGIADDKMEHRSAGGSVNVTNATQIVVKTEWPEP